MAKKRVYELAKEMSIEGKELLALLNANGIAVTTVHNSLSEEQEAAARQLLSGDKPEHTEKKPEADKQKEASKSPKAVKKPEASAQEAGRKDKTMKSSERGEGKDSHREKNDKGAAEKKQADRQSQGGKNSGRNAENKKNENRQNPGNKSGGQGNRPEQNSGNKNQKNGKHKNDQGKNSQSGTAHKQSQWVNPNLKKKNNQGNKNNNKNDAQKPVKQEPPKPQEPVIKSVKLPDVLTVSELADKIKVPAGQLVKKLFLAGKVLTINSDLDFDAAADLALEYNYIAEEEEKIDVIEELLREDEEDESLMVERPPVVCVMGHVDHGKTSLLDAIRQTSVTEGEAGGITQRIGAYTVEINGQKITFLDTPGHEAFTAMRMRGAQSTDIAILVVAADDGVMPQTIEAINHAKAAGIEIIVAVNKIDKESANVERVKQELMEYELVAEDWGGSTVFCPVSAHTREGIDNLLEMILLTAEVLELKANPNRRARGIVIEAELDKGRGPVATVLVQKGTLHVGDAVTVGNAHGKVRAMIDDKGRKVNQAGPSMPVEILGLNSVPGAGEICISTSSEKEARAMSEAFIAYGKEKLLADTKAKMSLDDLFSQIQAGNVKELNLVVKADVQGSVEAVKNSLLKLSNEEVVVKVIHSGVGAINESDVVLASASNAIIIGFNVRPDVQAKSIAEREQVDLRLYKVIYNAIEDIESAMKGMLDPVYEEKIIGHAEVRQTYKASQVGTIAGSYVLDGMVQRNCSVRIYREGEQIHEGALASLKRFKDDVKEVKAGFECGLVFEGFNDIKEEDQIEAYIMVEVPR